MSEDLAQSASHPIGRYNYLRLGATTLNQLKRTKYIKGSLTKVEEGRKPDGIVFLPRGGIKAVVEIKPPRELTLKKLPKIIEDYSPIAAAVCNLLIITSGKKSYWVNPHTREIVNHQGQDLVEEFFPSEIEARSITEEKATRIADLVEQCDQVLSPENSQLKEVDIVDPSQLAETVWQKIWITTGKEPEKCLYNVVEIFVFKFLSDTSVLKGAYSFKEVVEKLTQGTDVALDHYARMVRNRIRTLFPKGDDGTTVINGTIFVNEKGDPNHAQAQLFSEVIQDFQDFDDNYGSMRNINREFKARLYESFLRQSAGIKSLGQYFTPRSIVQAIVKMSNAGQLGAGARICDPFCGVGGFLLETIAESPSILAEFTPKKQKVEPKIFFRGYDKGTDEKEDERTIILAKANMLIYFSDLLGTYNSEAYLRQFSQNAFNEVFKLIRSNLGTFGLTEEDPYDLILTNPPYVTSGSRSLRNAIEASGLKDYYPALGRGTEALAIQWIIANLKLGGKAFIIVPDGLLNQGTVLQAIKEDCFVDAVVALPSRAFFSTPKKTYILAITRKTSNAIQQTNPVFTYLISEIGESRDSRRIPIDENNLKKMIIEYGYFETNKNGYKTHDPRCKIVPWNIFDTQSQWLVDRLWSIDEKRDLGLEKEESEVDEQTFKDMIGLAIKDLQKLLEIENEQTA